MPAKAVAQHNMIKLVDRFIQQRSTTTTLDTRSYWESRYRGGGTSGTGSYGRLAEFKASVLNNFVKRHGVVTVTEFGCGDGNQLRFAKYPRYCGLDIAPAALEKCIQAYGNDDTKQFLLYEPTAFDSSVSDVQADLSISLEVVFHIIEDRLYHTYMRHLFDSARKYVAIYSSNYEGSAARHVKHRKFTDWIDAHRPEWKLFAKVDNRFPFDPDHPEDTAFSDFYFFSNLKRG